MNHALLGQVLHHAPGGQFVVVGANQQTGDGLECLQKLAEVIETIERLSLGQGQRAGVVAGAQLRQRRGQNRSLQVQMQLGLGQPANVFLDFGHASSLTGS